jgi:hypothetical protein
MKDVLFFIGFFATLLLLAFLIPHCLLLAICERAVKAIALPPSCWFL